MKINETQKNKIDRFLNDEVMSEAVKEVILNSFLKPKPNRDVYQLAASRLAIDLLDESWKDLERFRNVVEQEKKQGGQIGL